MFPDSLLANLIVDQSPAIILRLVKNTEAFTKERILVSYLCNLLKPHMQSQSCFLFMSAIDNILKYHQTMLHRKRQWSYLKKDNSYIQSILFEHFYQKLWHLQWMISFYMAVFPSRSKISILYHKCSESCFDIVWAMFWPELNDNERFKTRNGEPDLFQLKKSAWRMGSMTNLFLLRFSSLIWCVWI